MRDAAGTLRLPFLFLQPNIRGKAASHRMPERPRYLNHTAKTGTKILPCITVPCWHALASSLVRMWDI